MELIVFPSTTAADYRKRLHHSEAPREVAD
jgi:hypothetical protein